MNFYYNQIKENFESNGITNFGRLPNDESEIKVFVHSFNNFQKTLRSARVQGFKWGKYTYSFMNDTRNITMEVKIKHEEYISLLQRYKEIVFVGNNDGESPYDLDPRTIATRMDRIDQDYVNRRFDTYVQELRKGDSQLLEKSLQDLHNSYTRLSREDQDIADNIILELQNGNFAILGENKTLSDLIADYKTNEKNDKIRSVACIFGLDENELRRLINLRPTELNINEHGRYSRMISSCDINCAKEYFDRAESRDVPLSEVATKRDELLREFIINGLYEFSPSNVQWFMDIRNNN